MRRIVLLLLLITVILASDPLGLCAQDAAAAKEPATGPGGDWPGCGRFALQTRRRLLLQHSEVGDCLVNVSYLGQVN